MTKLAGQFIAAGLVAWLGVQIYSLPIGGITVGSPLHVHRDHACSRSCS